MNVGITAVGSYLPPDVVTNHDLARTVDTSDRWILDHTGIRERRRARPGQASSDLGTTAAQAALRAGQLTPAQIDGLVLATSSPDYVQPTTASLVQAKLGLGPVPAFDVSAVCAGFVYALAVGAGLLGSLGQLNRLLIVGAEVYSSILDPDDRTTCVYFGDGAGAVVLAEVPAGYGILGTHLMTDGRLADVVGVPAGGSAEPTSAETLAARRHYFRMDGRRVWTFATEALPVVVKSALAEAGCSIGNVDHLITHQANARLIGEVGRALGISPDKIPMTVDRYGNTAAASVPITLDAALTDGRINSGDLVVLASVGGGMTAGAVVLRWY